MNAIYMGIYDGLKDAAKVLQEAGKIEQYKQILEVQEKMLDMQKQISELEKLNQELTSKLEIKAKLNQQNHAYWDDNSDGPFVLAAGM